MSYAHNNKEQFNEFKTHTIYRFIQNFHYCKAKPILILITEVVYLYKKPFDAIVRFILLNTSTRKLSQLL